MKIYNTLTKKKEEFVPLNPPHVKMYACGITVSGEAHLGHFLQAMIFDIIRKYLEKIGFDVTYARNYTDIDDKIIAASNKLGVDSVEYAKNMIKKIDDRMAKLQVGQPNIWLKATENIDNIIAFVQKLINSGHAYSTENGDVYFSVDTFKGYGKLSNRKTEDALDGVRIDNEENKRSPLDFALWKSAKPGEPSWQSPWGKGRPGWHIECSAMNMKAFGDQIDIHGGGRDLVFPHHENEIAQTESITGKQFAKYWIHNGLIKVNGQKMSKSLSNGITLDELLNSYHVETLKFAMLQTNFHNDINITPDLLPEAQKHMAKFHGIIKEVEEKFGSGKPIIFEIDNNFNSAMDDDFNTARAIADLFGYFKKIQTKIVSNDKSAADDVATIKKTFGLLGLFVNPSKEFLEFGQSIKENNIPEDIIKLAEQRKIAKQEKNYSKADEIRNKILELGYIIKDTPSGFEIEKK